MMMLGWIPTSMMVIFFRIGDCQWMRSTVRYRQQSMWLNSSWLLSDGANVQKQWSIQGFSHHGTLEVEGQCQTSIKVWWITGWCWTISESGRNQCRQGRGIAQGWTQADSVVMLNHSKWCQQWVVERPFWVMSMTWGGS
jgi:hypothetical protein